MRELVRANLKRQFDGASEASLRRLLAERWLGHELAAKVYGPSDTHGRKPGSNPLCCRGPGLVAKLEWYRAGGELSERQWGDILGDLRVNSKSLDFEGMQESASELVVSDLLARALIEAGLH